MFSEMGREYSTHGDKRNACRVLGRKTTRKEIIGMIQTSVEG
jgi:hypothetical protein